MTIEESFHKALGEGYVLPNENTLVYWKNSNLVFHDSRAAVASTYDIFLDPLFWQSLGKALGWNGCNFGDGRETFCSWKLSWKEEWHRFIDHLAEGKDAESFFKTLN